MQRTLGMWLMTHLNFDSNSIFIIQYKILLDLDP